MTPCSNTRIAVICADGIGDALIMHIASANLVKAGYQVVTYSDHLSSFGAWLPSFALHKQPHLGAIDTLFQDFDAIILQHDNSAKAHQIRRLQCPIYTLFGSYVPSKHGLLQKTDYICDPHLSMVQNLTHAMQLWFNLSSVENGLEAPEGLHHRKDPRRVVIHPGSRDPTKNWPYAHFVSVASFLKSKGYTPFFSEERGQPPKFPNLESFASFLYESGAFVGNDSGPAHLASYLQIPSIVIGKGQEHMQLWRPGWSSPLLATPPRWVSHFKWTRERWKYFIPPSKITKTIQKQFVTK